MKKIIWILVALVVGGYYVNSYIEEKVAREAKRTEDKRIEQATRAAVSAMVLRTNAIDNWESQLNKGKRRRRTPILTVELEWLWLNKEPILFIGVIKDIATHDQTQYKVTVEREGPFSRFEYHFGIGLQLSLISRKEIVDTFLRKHPDIFEYSRRKNGVAVVARISSIRSTSIPGEEWEVKIGDGELVDIMYTGNVRY